MLPGTQASKVQPGKQESFEWVRVTCARAREIPRITLIHYHCIVDEANQGWRYLDFS